MENAGLRFEICAAQIDERAIDAALEAAGATPVDIATALAREKAIEVSTRFRGCIVIGSDQTMSLGDRVYHKPRDLAEAKSHILWLSGKQHRLNSAIALVRDGELIWEYVSTANLLVRNISEEFVDRYIEKVGEKALTSVGAYQLEGEGIQLFSRIDGDYFTILGLPMLPLLQILRDLGAING